MEMEINMWESGKITIDDENFEYHVKIYEEPSAYGINKGRISKLEVNLVDEAGSKFVVALYDRKWEFKPKLEIAKKVVQQIMSRYN